MVVVTMIISVLFAVTGSANPGKPSFGPELYADGEVWGTKGTTNLPAPNEHNRQSFDKLFVITNSNNPEGQMPVGEFLTSNKVIMLGLIGAMIAVPIAVYSSRDDSPSSP